MYKYPYTDTRLLDSLFTDLIPEDADYSDDRVSREDLRDLVMRARKDCVSELSSWLEHDITCAFNVDLRNHDKILPGTECDCYLDIRIKELTYKHNQDR